MQAFEKWLDLCNMPFYPNYSDITSTIYFIFNHFNYYSYHTLQNLSRPLPGGSSYHYRRGFFHCFFAIVTTIQHSWLWALFCYISKEIKTNEKLGKKSREHNTVHAVLWHLFLFEQVAFQCVTYKAAWLINAAVTLRLLSCLTQI